MIHICETCGGDGTMIEFRRFAGEYMAGEPVEVCCPDCDGEGEFDDEPPARKPFVPDPQYVAWCAEIDAKRAAEQFTVCSPDPLRRRA